MEEQFQLKTYGDLSLFEQNQMTAEERGWWMRRLQRHFDEEKAKANSNTTTTTPSYLN